MTFNGTVQQNQWAEKILKNNTLTDIQIDNLLKYAGPTMYAQKIMDVTIIIEHRKNLAAYADALGIHYGMTEEEKQSAAENAANLVRELVREKI